MEKKILSENELNQVAGGFGGSTIASGSFTSNTGTQLNLLVNWSVQTDGYLYVDVCATSYSLYSNGGGVELTANSPVTNRLASFAIPGLSGAVSLSAVWHFNGSYSGTPIGDIRASGVVNV